MSDKQPDRQRIDWRGANLRGSDMAGMNLDYADLRASDCREVNFSGSSLRYADFRGACVQGANFQKASLYGAKMQGVEADGADFRNSDMRHVNLGGAYMQGAVMPLPSPGQIGDGLGQEERIWRQQIAEGRTGSPDGEAGNDRKEQTSHQPPPEQQHNGRGRGR